MRYQQLSGKEIINIHTGDRLGVLGQTDLQINKQTGEITALIIPSYKWFGLRKDSEESYIPWHAIKKFGKDIILIDFPE